MANCFVVTSELIPPKGTNPDALPQTARSLDEYVDAFNVTDFHAAHMSLSPIVAAHNLIAEGFEPIPQMATRDRNRIAIQSDMLGASLLGITNRACMGGDPPNVGDHPHAKPYVRPTPITAAAMLRHERAVVTESKTISE